MTITRCPFCQETMILSAVDMPIEFSYAEEAQAVAKWAAEHKCALKEKP